MTTLTEIEEGIDSLLASPIYAVEPAERQRAVLELLKREVAFACSANPRFGNYVRHWPVDFRQARTIAELPYLPVGAFKAKPPLALVPAAEVKRTLTSSSTTGQTPSRVALDGATAKRMTKAVTTIIKDFIGPTRRPYLVIDLPGYLAGQAELGARSAAIQGLGCFATEIQCCLRVDSAGEPTLDLEKLLECAARWRQAEVLVYGFTFVIWKSLVQPLLNSGITLGLPNVHVLHSGGWKRLEQEAVSKQDFIGVVAAVFGCPLERVIDYYGMVENVGVVYPDCAYGNKHVPTVGEVIVRDPLTLAPVEVGQKGLVQVCSVLPTSFPGYLLLTEDMGEVIAHDGCPCGRRGTSFRFVQRVPKAENRGCGNLEAPAAPAWAGSSGA
jgi:hypothetical protein